MRIQISLFALVATAATQFTTSIQGTGEVTVTSVSASTPRPADMPTTPIAIYTPPVETIDSWLCATKNYSDYLKPPMPTGHLLDIYYDHSDAIYKECEDKLPKPFTTFPACPSVAKASWCAISTAVPSSELAEFRSYTSVASSWWAAHSSALADIQDECPNTWKDTKLDIPGGEIWLNATIALADCAAEEPVPNAPIADTSPSQSSTTSPSQSTTTPATGNASSATKISVVSAALGVGAMLML